MGEISICLNKFSFVFNQDFGKTTPNFGWCPAESCSLPNCNSINGTTQKIFVSFGYAIKIEVLGFNYLESTNSGF